MTIAVHLGLDNHVTNVCKTCFFWLWQLRRVHRSLDIELVQTLVDAFVTSCVDYCNCFLSNAPKITDKLQHVQNAATRLVTGTRKYECGLSLLMHSDLHWLVTIQAGPQDVSVCRTFEALEVLRNRAV